MTRYRTLMPGAIEDSYLVLRDPDAQYTSRIAAIEALRIHLYAFQATLVEDARRREGLTWEEVGQALGGISKQAAQQRFAWAEVE